MSSLERDAGTHVPWEAQGWELEHRDPGAIPRRGQLLTAGRRLRGPEGRSRQWERPEQETRAAREAGRPAESLQAVEPSLWASLSPQVSPEREGPRERLACYCLHGGREPGAEKDWPQRRSDHSRQRPGRTPWRARAPSAETAGVPAHSAPPEFPRSEQLCHPTLDAAGAELPEARKPLPGALWLQFP